ncbi:hypothetical protein AU198_25465 [Mycobacterium sp. GA-1199]|uniref:helix-turn-helix transcriptional regulator n=1 Tax=Mycobacterium sp. GA-1199 TaxID=1772287 RepID=UPI00074A7B58|nr:helix-turn-helix domain-containing protein [Mycobacterium sp. GA-1199]KUI43874.1 hypothetical protein AU198_25465 [Mycobacterium sp. GA-1199]
MSKPKQDANGDTERPGLGTSKEVAKVVRTTEAHLARLRHEGRGPDYIKLGRSVRYRWEDVERWIAENTVNTSELA